MCFLLLLSGTMVINSDSDDSSTARKNDFNKPRYRPQFLDHFERKNPEVKLRRSNSGNHGVGGGEKSNEYSPAEVQRAAALDLSVVSGDHYHQQQNIAMGGRISDVGQGAAGNNAASKNTTEQSSTQNEPTNWENNLDVQFKQISAINQYGLQKHQQQQLRQQQQQQQAAAAAAAAYYGYDPALNSPQLLAINQQQQLQSQQQLPSSPTVYSQQQAKQQQPSHQLHSSSSTAHAYIDGEFEFLKFLTFDDLNQRLNNIDTEMEKEIEELNKKYNAKRQPIVDAMNAKRKRQQNINNNLIKI